MPTQIDVKRIVPVMIIGLLFLAFAANGMKNWLVDMMDSSYRTVGQYEKRLAIPNPPKQLPKDSYICNPPQKLPWVGCSIQP